MAGEEDFITREEFDKFRRAVIKKLKAQDDLISDAFLKISDVDDAQTQMIDEANGHANRAERAVRRIKKALDEHKELPEHAEE